MSICLITMQSYFGGCYFCRREATDRLGVPIGPDGRSVPNDYTGEWCGVPACKECYDRHERGDTL